MIEPVSVIFGSGLFKANSSIFALNKASNSFVSADRITATFVTFSLVIKKAPTFLAW